jgi:hypothetical protein
VTVKENMSAGFVTNTTAGMLESMAIYGEGDAEITLSGIGKKLELPMQPLWAGLKVCGLESTGGLHFDGNTRNNLKVQQDTGIG